MLVVAIVAACGQPVATPEPVLLEVAGAPEAASAVEALAVGFQAATANVSLEVNDPGSSAALQALRAGEADLAFVSWQPVDLLPEAGAGWHAVAVARDGLAVIVHPDNPLSGVGLLQLQDLFGGRAGDWTAVGDSRVQGAVHPVVREEGSGARAAFDLLVMEGYRVTPNARVALSPAAVVAAVAGDVHAIGYVSTAVEMTGVKVLEVEGLVPAGEAVAAGSYPLTYEIWFVTTEAPAGVLRQFVDWTLAPAGQEILARFFEKVN